MGGQLFGAGTRFLLDQQQRFTRAGLPVFLRIKNFDDAGEEYVKLGFQYSPTGGQQTGFDDVPITPPPEVREVSLHNIGLNQTRLRFGAKYFVISHSFVLIQMNKMQVTDPYKVWDNPRLVGLLYQNQLFEIVSPTHEDVAGEIVSWTLLCNAQERTVVST